MQRLNQFHKSQSLTVSEFSGVNIGTWTGGAIFFVASFSGDIFFSLPDLKWGRQWWYYISITYMRGSGGFWISKLPFQVIYFILNFLEPISLFTLSNYPARHFLKESQEEYGPPRSPSISFLTTWNLLALRLDLGGGWFPLSIDIPMQGMKENLSCKKWCYDEPPNRRRRRLCSILLHRKGALFFFPFLGNLSRSIDVNASASFSLSVRKFLGRQTNKQTWSCLVVKRPNCGEFLKSWCGVCRTWMRIICTREMKKVVRINILSPQLARR